jgi:hypothetical protein
VQQGRRAKQHEARMCELASRARERGKVLLPSDGEMVRQHNTLCPASGCNYKTPL